METSGYTGDGGGGQEIGGLLFNRYRVYAGDEKF